MSELLKMQREDRLHRPRDGSARQRIWWLLANFLVWAAAIGVAYWLLH